MFSRILHFPSLSGFYLSVNSLRSSLEALVIVLPWRCLESSRWDRDVCTLWISWDSCFVRPLPWVSHYSVSLLSMSWLYHMLFSLFLLLLLHFDSYCFLSFTWDLAFVTIRASVFPVPLSWLGDTLDTVFWIWKCVTSSDYLRKC